MTRTIKSEVRLNQTIMLPDGTVDVVNDFDGSFYFLKNSDEVFRAHSMVDEVPGESVQSSNDVLESALMDVLNCSEEEACMLRETILEKLNNNGYHIIQGSKQ
ncbi:hypothetical protein [Rossellomorea marisflavi]|uniref:hypothetical protein n=1 Tax=Rossellomorea marisflavi TaxID=189381 RepID=UPI003F9F7113